MVSLRICLDSPEHSLLDNVTRSKIMALTHINVISDDIYVRSAPVCARSVASTQHGHFYIQHIRVKNSFDHYVPVSFLHIFSELKQRSLIKLNHYYSSRRVYPCLES